jgi:uncharacterized membrane protein
MKKAKKNKGKAKGEGKPLTPAKLETPSKSTSIPEILTPRPIPTAARQPSVQAIQQTFSGPLPPPKVLKEYNEIMPGLAGIIVARANTEMEHRHSLEKHYADVDKNYLSDETSNGRLGLWLAFFIGIFVLIIAGILAWNGFAWQAVAVGGVDLAALVGVFVYGSRNNTQPTQEEENQK